MRIMSQHTPPVPETQLLSNGRYHFMVSTVGGIYIDDRDEWDEHRVAYGYPLDLVERLEALAVDLERRVKAREAPFDEATAEVWLERLHALPT